MDSEHSKKDHLIINEGLNSPLIQMSSYSILIPSKSICKIECKIGTSINLSSGFLIKFFKGEKDFFCLMTNEHVITKELINQKKTIFLYYNYESKVKEIQLNPEERYIKDFTEIGIDATVVEIIFKDNIEQDYFLLPCIEYMNTFNELLNKEISIIQFPLGGKLSYSNGTIVKFNKYEFTHDAGTQSGSSGSPAFLKDNIRVIGIHKGRGKDNSENYGDFIGPIFNYFKNELKYKIILDNGDYYIGELENNLKHGKGIIYYNNGKIKYEGDFINDKYEGYGKYIDENGEYYIGEWSNGLRHGKGTIYNKNNTIKYEGDFVNGEFIKQNNI
jgi:hypothetical protein